ncbi:MAG: Fe-S protein [Rhodospirillaceae bacterium]|nr:Fe-S protein [Rhodospirillaceae bacterium]
MIFFSNKTRPFHYGPYPIERLKRDQTIVDREASLPRRSRPQVALSSGSGPLSSALDKYHALYCPLGRLDVLPPKAPVPDDLDRRMIDIKGAGYFLDVAHVGICEMPETAWLANVDMPGHSHAITIVQAHGRVPEEENLAYEWISGLGQKAASLRAFEVAIAIASHIQYMGFAAQAHDWSTGDVDLDRLAVLSGVVLREGNGIINPYLEDKFAVAAVTTDYALSTDLPLHASSRRGKGLSYWLGLGGAVPGIEWNRRAKRRSDLGIFPMEQVDRVEEATTLIHEDEIPRVPKRANFFMRARSGDLGDKAKREVARFAFKHPFALSMTSLIKAMVPHQDGAVGEIAPGYENADANTRALKSLSYFLGAEITGVCEIPDYAWYSHGMDGSPIDPYHKYAVVMLIDQGYETMEGASGDDFISGAQSMRAYMRGAQIAGIMGDMLRTLGFPSRSQTNADSDLLHTPVTLLAGLGELSRIGEVILNPFIGPRLKTVVLTTDFPLVPDKMVDFGLQYFCSNCWKCARECPCDSISWGDKVMFNGYEMWKPDVERCTRYRVTNPKGLACGRCMKTCPLNKVVTWQGPLMTRIASWIGVNVRWMKPLLVPIAVWLDDILRQGVRNPVKKWWLDMEIVDGVCVDPTKGVNQRDLNLDHKIVASEQKMAYYHADRMPPPDQEGPYAVDRKEVIVASSLLETPAEAVDRRAKGGARPAQYRPPPLVAAGGSGSVEAETTPWGDALKKEDKRLPTSKSLKL